MMTFFPKFHIFICEFLLWLSENGIFFELIESLSCKTKNFQNKNLLTLNFKHLPGEIYAKFLKEFGWVIEYLVYMAFFPVVCDRLTTLCYRRKMLCGLLRILVTISVSRRCRSQRYHDIKSKVTLTHLYYKRLF